jgi:putative phosphoesterase
VHVVVLADTHAPRRWRVCPPRVAEHLRTADRILHAGDVCTAAVLDELAEYAPVTAVLGNNDGPDVAEWGALRTAELDLDGLKVNMVHDSGVAAGRLTRLTRRFPRADLVVFGHSHIPLDQSAPRAPGGPNAPSAPGGPNAPSAPGALNAPGLRIFNPGSPTDRRRQPHGTLGLLQIQDGRLITAAIVPVT